MRTIAVYGKGGIGKSTVASALAVCFARDGRRVLLVGCDPKHDSSYRLVERRAVRTVMGVLHQKGDGDVAVDDILMRSRVARLDCIETGGPEPGVGCAGRGITRMFELLAELGLPGAHYDVVIYDVLGDVVCGGFAAPIRGGHAREIYIVLSGEVMAMYAGNLICRALVNNARSGARLGGLVGNLRGVPREASILTAFATTLGAQLLQLVPRDPLVSDAEAAGLTVLEHAPDAPAALAARLLYEAIDRIDPQALPEPEALDDDGFERFIQQTRELA